MAGRRWATICCMALSATEVQSGWLSSSAFAIVCRMHQESTVRCTHSWLPCIMRWRSHSLQHTTVLAFLIVPYKTQCVLACLQDSCTSIHQSNNPKSEEKKSDKYRRNLNPPPYIGCLVTLHLVQMDTGCLSRQKWYCYAIKWNDHPLTNRVRLSPESWFLTGWTLLNTKLDPHSAIRTSFHLKVWPLNWSEIFSEFTKRGHTKCQFWLSMAILVKN